MANVAESRFIRTTEPDHRRSVQAFWAKLKVNGAIVKGSHSGYYSTNEETFFPEKDLERNESGEMTVPATGEVCEYVTEQNYVFKFTQDQMRQVVDWAG